MPSKGNSIAEGILTVLAIIGGALIVNEITKSVAKKITVYSCPVCANDVTFGTEICPNCQSHLSWGDKKTAI